MARRAAAWQDSVRTADLPLHLFTSRPSSPLHLSSLFTLSGSPASILSRHVQLLSSSAGCRKLTVWAELGRGVQKSIGVVQQAGATRWGDQSMAVGTNGETAAVTAATAPSRCREDAAVAAAASGHKLVAGTHLSTLVLDPHPPIAGMSKPGGRTAVVFISQSSTLLPRERMQVSPLLILIAWSLCVLCRLMLLPLLLPALAAARWTAMIRSDTRRCCSGAASGGWSEAELTHASSWQRPSTHSVRVSSARRPLSILRRRTSNSMSMQSTAARQCPREARERAGCVCDVAQLVTAAGLGMV